MDYIYHLANASLTLRIVEHLLRASSLPLAWMTVIHQIGGWVVKVRMNSTIEESAAEDLRAYLTELGIPHEPNIRLRMALWGLETGQSPVDVMRRYQVAVVSHGRPDRKEIEAFRSQFVMGLGYCPETLA
uniref:Arsenate reductase n=1 Tax=Leptolyngbya tenuis S3 TaxID=1676975 RepID=A0A0S2SW60_9CYAN|nr:arsenate reductase [Leptolyngbya tenuis S3]